jgi:hypothetical protein
MSDPNSHDTTIIRIWFWTCVSVACAGIAHVPNLTARVILTATLCAAVAILAKRD